MLSTLLTDWLTIRGSGTTAVVQSEIGWLDVTGFSDAIFWVEIAEVTNPGSGVVALSFETAPAPQETLFARLDGIFAVAASTTPVVLKAFMNEAPSVPLARLLRWKLAGTAAGTWDVTFRVHVTLGRGVRSAFSPRMLPGLVLWMRADQGLTLDASNKVSQWNDLTGLSNRFASQSTGALQPTWVPNAINSRPAIDFSSSRYLENSLTSLVATGTAYSVLAVAKGGNGTFLSIRRSRPYSATMFFLSNTYVYSDSGANNSIATPSTLPITQSGPAFKSCHRYGGTGQNPLVWLNGSALSISGVGQAGESGSTGFQIGTNSQTVPEPWNGLLAELIVTSNTIADADRKRIELYQRNFFGV